MTMDGDTVTVSELADNVGLPKRLVVYWTDQGVLVPEGHPTGSGNYRRYSHLEHRICLILAHLVPLEMSARIMAKLAAGLRAHLLSEPFNGSIKLMISKHCSVIVDLTTVDLTALR